MKEQKINLSIVKKKKGYDFYYKNYSLKYDISQAP